MSSTSIERALREVHDVEGRLSSVRRTLLSLALQGRLTDRSDDPPVEALSGMRTLLAQRPRYRWDLQPPSGDARGRPGWTVWRLGDTALYINGLAFKRSDRGRSGRPIIRIQNLSGAASEHHYTERDVDPDNIIHDGDLLVSWSATLDTFVWRGPEAVLNQHIFKVVPNLTAVQPSFLYWLLKHEVQRLADSQHAHGLAMMHINRGPFLNHAVALPPLAEQDVIARKIEDVMRICDELAAAARERDQVRDRLRAVSLAQMTAPAEAPGRFDQKDATFFISHSGCMVTKREHVEDLRRAVLDLAVRGRLIGRDEETRVVALRDLLVELMTGPFGSVLHQSDYTAGGTPVINPASIQDGRLVPMPNMAVGLDVLDRLGRFRLRAGDVLVARRGEMGRAAVVGLEEDGWLCGTGCLVLRPTKAITPEYLAMALGAPSSRAYLGSSAVGTTMQNLNQKILLNLRLVLPSVTAQLDTLSTVNQLMGVCDELEQSLRSAEEGRAQLLEAVLYEALNGRSAGVELEVATAEPAHR